MDIQEQADKENIRYCIKAFELSAKSLGKVAMFFIKRRLSKEPVGEVKYKKFLKKAKCDIKTLSLKNADVKLLSKIAKDYGIGFAVMKDKEDKNYTLFFKAKNEVILVEAMKKYLAVSLKKQQEQEKKQEQDKAQPEQKQQKESHEQEQVKEKSCPERAKSDIDLNSFKRSPIREKLKLASQRAYQINKQRAIELNKIKRKELSR